MKYEVIIIVDNNAYGIWESGKMIPQSLDNRGKYWDIEYLSTLSYPDIHKYCIKKQYPTTKIISITDEKIGGIKKMYINAIKELHTEICENVGLKFSKNMYFVTVGNESPKIEENKFGIETYLH